MSAGRGSSAPGKPGMDLGVAAARPGAGLFDRRIIGVGVVFVVLMAVSGRYGFVRTQHCSRSPRRRDPVELNQRRDSACRVPGSCRT